MSFVLPELPYATDSLQPFMSAETLEFHHGKHHQAYINNANKLIADTPLEKRPLEEIIRETVDKPEHLTLFNNAAQHWNHSFFWQCMKPLGGGAVPGGLEARLKEDFGGIDAFRQDFINAAVTLFGSGWVWLVLDNDKLKIVKGVNANTPVANDQLALLAIDVWEHAYYIDYRNKRPDFVHAFFDNLIDWEFVAYRLTGHS
ncbi:MAG: superoxide dismutase [Pseudomonadota bacterium]|nr:superoxide dismutase [Pseudomonadota bacterium]